MGSVNRAILMGHLGRDPEIRTTNNGAKVASFSLATSESWKDKTSGERKTATEWHNIVVWNEALVSVVERFLKKGALVYVSGPIKTRKYADKNGVDRYVTEIVLPKFGGEIVLAGGGPGRAPGPDSPDDYGEHKSAAAAASGGAAAMDDEIPF